MGDGITVRSLSFSYGPDYVFKDFNISSESNPVLFRGPSGCGKTTLLKLITGNLPPLNGASLPGYPRKLLVLQEDALFPWLSGMANIKRILQIEVEVIKRHPMYEVVQGFITKPTFSMSFGQRRLIELFRAVLYAPDLLCLDEPFNYLDPDSRTKASHYLLALRELGTQLVISSHYAEDFATVDAPIFRFSGRLPVSELSIDAVHE